MKLKLPNWGSLCNPNLLMNSDFRNGAINQKGQTQYINTSYKSTMTIDGWFTDYGSVNVFANSVYFDNTGSSEYGFKQPLNLQNGTYTFYLDCAINGSARVFARNISNEEVINETVSGTVKKSFTFTNSLKFITIIAASGAKISFNFMKLENGSHYTGMPVWNETIELLKCMPSFQRVEAMFVAARSDGNTYFFGDKLRVMMRKDPSATVKQLLNPSGLNLMDDFSTIYAYKNKIDYIVLKNAKDYIVIRATIFLDAYDYN